MRTSPPSAGVTHAGGLRNLFVLITLASLGLFLAVTLATERVGVSGTALCRAGSGCERVLESRYASLAGVRLAWLGAAAYLVVLGAYLACATTRSKDVYARSRALARWTGLLATLASGVLLYVQLGVIRALCAMCVTSAVLFVVIYLLTERLPTAPPVVRGRGRTGMLVLVLLAAGLLGAGAVAVARRSAVVARIGGEPLTAAQMNREFGAALEALDRQAYEAKVDWIRRKAAERLLEKEARRRGITVEELLDREVESKVDVTDAEIDAWREENKSTFTEAERRERLRRSLKAQKRAQLREALVNSLGGTRDVEILLPPPRVRRVTIDVAGAATDGPADAGARLVVFSEFECPHCAKLAAALRKLREAHPEDVSVTFLHFPIDDHAGSMQAAVTAACAQDQGAFWPLHDRLFAARAAGERTAIDDIAAAAGLDTVRLEACRRQGEAAARVRKELEEARRLGIREVPTLFLNGRRIGGALSYEDLERLVDSELRSPWLGGTGDGR